MALMIWIIPSTDAVTVATSPLSSIMLVISKKLGFKCRPNAPSNKASIPSFACGFAFVTFERLSNLFIDKYYIGYRY